MKKKVTRIGIGGPVGSGKTAIVEAITPRLLEMGIKVLIITNDVVTTEDAKHVQRKLKGILLEQGTWRGPTPRRRRSILSASSIARDIRKYPGNVQPDSVSAT